MLNKLEKFSQNTSLIQKLIFTLWLVIFVSFSATFLGASYDSEKEDAVNILVGTSIVAFILFKVWANKKSAD